MIMGVAHLGMARQIRKSHPRRPGSPSGHRVDCGPVRPLPGSIASCWQASPAKNDPTDAAHPRATRLSCRGRRLEAAPGPGRPRQLEVKRRNPGTEKLSQCDIPGVV